MCLVLNNKIQACNTCWEGPIKALDDAKTLLNESGKILVSECKWPHEDWSIEWNKNKKPLNGG